MTNSTPALIAVLGGGVLLYFAVQRRRQNTSYSPTPVEDLHPTSTYCDIRTPTPCGDGRECIPLFAEGEAPAGMENLGVCLVPGAPQGVAP